MYRYVYVCRVSWVETAAQRKICNYLISGMICGLSVSLTICSFLYREKSFFYLNCMGRADYYYSQQESSIRLVWLLPLYHPFHLVSILAFFCYALLVPLGYFEIYRFRKQQDARVMGLSNLSRKVRIKKNLVTTQFNMIIWICEVLSGFLIFLPGSQVIVIVFIFIPNSISPVLYYVGIELNRQAMKSHFQELFKESKRTEVFKQN